MGLRRERDPKAPAQVTGAVGAKDARREPAEARTRGATLSSASDSVTVSWGLDDRVRLQEGTSAVFCFVRDIAYVRAADAHFPIHIDRPPLDDDRSPLRASDGRLERNRSPQPRTARSENAASVDASPNTALVFDNARGGVQRSIRTFIRMSDRVSRSEHVVISTATDSLMRSKHAPRTPTFLVALTVLSIPLGVGCSDDGSENGTKGGRGNQRGWGHER